MGGLFEFLSENLFLVMIAVSAIIGFLSGDKKEQEQKQKRVPRPKPVQTRSIPKHSETTREKTITRSNRQEVLTTKLEPTERTVTSSHAESYESKQQAQLERLQKKLGTEISSDVKYSNFIAEQDLTFSKSLENVNHFSEEQEELKKNIRGSLRKRGLINGIIMAEVLGKPRALKPYQSVIVERYKK